MNFHIFTKSILSIVLSLSSLFLAAQSSTVVIGEVLYDTPLQEANGTVFPHNGEFISFYNYGNNTVNVSGWTVRIDGSTKYTFPSGTFVPPYGILAVAYRAAGSDFNTDFFYSSIIGTKDRLLCQSSMILPNRTTNITLHSVTGTVEDEIIYDGDDALPSGVPPMRARNTLNPDRAGNQSVSLQRKNITKNNGRHIFLRSDYQGGTSSLVRLFQFNTPLTLTLTRDGNVTVAGYTGFVNGNNYDIDTTHFPVADIDLGSHSESEDIPSLGGTINISNSGATVYELELNVPQGVALTPELSLTYNSQAKTESVLGYSFYLNGSSQITRSGKNFFYDGEVSPIDYNSGTIFSLDGKRLVCTGTDVNVFAPMSAPSSIPYNPDLATTTLDYEVSDESSFARIRYSGNQFTVNTKEGKTLYYGGTPNALSKLSNGKIHGFLLRKIVDAWGNEVNYYYNNANGEEPSVSEIVYGGATDCKVIFDYDTRKLTRKYIASAGNVLLQKKLLKRIRMQVNGMTAHAYNMVYDEPVISNSSSNIISIDTSASDAADFTTRLLSIQKEYVNVQDTTLTLPLTFTWSPALRHTLGSADTLPYPAAIVETDESNPYTHRAVADIDGDGIMDVVELSDPKTKFLIDINGDGKSELLVRTATSGLTVYFTKDVFSSHELGDLKDETVFETVGTDVLDINGSLLTDL
ncbi:MAG: lamin tail domain-containing protein, partial [Bacteroidales bacterium]|nr:lamin tail domain-containing protein [Bacteroidales bacterium]